MGVSCGHVHEVGVWDLPILCQAHLKFTTDLCPTNHTLNCGDKDHTSNQPYPVEHCVASSVSGVFVCSWKQSSLPYYVTSDSSLRRLVLVTIGEYTLWLCLPYYY